MKLVKIVLANYLINALVVPIIKIEFSDKAFVNVR